MNASGEATVRLLVLSLLSLTPTQPIEVLAHESYPISAFGLEEESRSKAKTFR